MNPEEVQKFAMLARIETTDAELNKLTKEIESVLEYVSQIKGAVADQTDTRIESAAVRNVFREDDESHSRGIYTDVIVSAAPEKEGAYIRVKKIL